jgi:hypothetical protein
MLVFWSYSVFGQNHLCVKDAVNRDFTFRVMPRPEEIQVPCQPSRRCVIPSGRSIRPNEVLSRPDFRQTNIIRPDDMPLPSGHSAVSRSFLCQLVPSGRLSSKSGHPSALDQSLILSKFQERENQSTARTMWYPVRTRVSIRQESQFEFDRLNT